MAKVLIFAEHHNGIIKPVTFEILGKITGHNCDVAVIGKLNADSAKELGTRGAKNLIQLQGAGLEKYSPEGYAEAVKGLITKNKYEYVFAGSTSSGKDFIPRLAVHFESGMISEVVNFEFSGDSFKGLRPLFAGKVLANVEVRGPKPYFITVRPNALGMPTSTPGGNVSVLDENATTGQIRALVQEIIKGASEKVDLTEANIIVSGGRAMKAKENFNILNELADVIGATVGASRAAVDSGYASHSMQVGQTGKTVSPSLYIACGISGSIQHQAGMRTSKVIIAINTDPEAPIFQKADYGIVGDLFKVVPILTQEMKKLLGK